MQRDNNSDQQHLPVPARFGETKIPGKQEHVHNKPGTMGEYLPTMLATKTFRVVQVCNVD